MTNKCNYNFELSPLCNSLAMTGQLLKTDICFIDELEKGLTTFVWVINSDIQYFNIFLSQQYQYQFSASGTRYTQITKTVVSWYQWNPLIPTYTCLLHIFMTRQIGSSALLKSVVILLLTCYFPWSILGHSWGISISKNSSQPHCWLLAGRIREAAVL